MSGEEAVLPAGITHYRGSLGQDVGVLAAALKENSTVTE